MDSLASAQNVFEIVMAGTPPAEVSSHLNVLSDADRQSVLCTLCAMRIEIANTSLQHGNEVASVLTEKCPLFIDGIATCLLDNCA